MRGYRRCLLLLADGARPDLLQDLCKQGRLPAISDRLVSVGSLREGVSVFPSTTGPAYLPFLTGCYPGTCNIPGIRWFDKDRYAAGPLTRKRFRSYVGAETFCLNGDIAPGIRTLFDLIPRSVNIFSSVNRGVGFKGNKTRFSRIWYWYYSHLTDHWGQVDRAAEEKTVRAVAEDFEFIFVVFPGIDEFSHLASPFHSRTIEAYQALDRAVGRIVDRLQEEGKWEETAFFIVSDHGLSETSNHLPLNQFLEKGGISTLYYPKVVFKRRFDCASMVSGNGMANLYFRNGCGWRGRTSWEEMLARGDRIVERLLQRPEVDLVAGEREDGSVVVRSRRGEAEVRGGPILRYRMHGSDPFGYAGLPETMTDRQSLELTATTDYPDALVQILQIFRSPRAGDVILSAARGHDLRLRHEIPEHKSSHGSLHREHMSIPVVSNVRLPEGPIRSVDLFPTILRLLGRPVPPGIDGLDIS